MPVKCIVQCLVFVTDNCNNNNWKLSQQNSLVKAKVFPVVMYGCENWTVKKAEHWKMDAFEPGFGEDSKVTWTAKRFNQSILKDISSECSLEGLMLKLKLQYFGQSVLRTEDPDTGKDWRWEEKGMTLDKMVGWHHWLNADEFE